MATLITTKSLISPNPNLTFHPTKQSLLLSPNRLSLSLHKNPNSKILSHKFLSTKIPVIVSTNKIQSTIFSDSTRTISTLAALTFALVRKFSAQITQPNVINTVGPLFFASVRSRPVGYLNTPLTVVAAGLSKWLDIYSGVLMVRVLLSWFPNIPWERQPLSAIRDLCDPYLNLFRNIIPPIFDTLDVSPLLAFAVLGTLGSILK